MNVIGARHSFWVFGCHCELRRNPQVTVGTLDFHLAFINLELCRGVIKRLQNFPLLHRMTALASQACPLRIRMTVPCAKPEIVTYYTFGHALVLARDNPPREVCSAARLQPKIARAPVKSGGRYPQATLFKEGFRKMKKIYFCSSISWLTRDF